ncbi:MAG: glycosyltransferase family 4 protein, partial [bacterium]
MLNIPRDENNSVIKRIAFIGNYLPRLCGIATFTTDLCEAVAAENEETTCIALPVNDTDEGYEYSSRVRFEIIEKDIDSYRRAADFLNINNVDLVCLQHEYGIFGGLVGSHILALLRELRMPIVTTLHTILVEPNPDQRRVLEEIADLSDRLVVMSQRGKEFLTDIYHVDSDKIDFIPHGIPDVPFVDPSFHKDLFGVEGKMVLLSFGLLSSSKGIENVIEALPAIVAEHPNVVYMILGETHPHVKEIDGEAYRLSLQWLARERGVESNVIFYNRFVSLEELVEFIGAADIYITPYLNEAQITSGTLAYTLGAGKAIISTPYWYAEEMLAEERGVLVPFRDSLALSQKVIDLLNDETRRNAMRKRAYMFGRDMIWSQVARQYRETFERARAERRHFSSPGFTVKALDKYPGELPPLKLDHLRNMTDETGILQHAIFTIPNYNEGYTTDDNARALIVSALLEDVGNHEAFELASRYLGFIWYAYNAETGRFRNFMNYQRTWLEVTGSDDSHGRALWALGTVLGRSHSPALHRMAGWLFEQALPAILDTTSPRAWAFALIAIHEYLRRFAGDRRASQVQEELSQRLLTLYQQCRTDDWRWYEEGLTYCNAVLPHASLICGQSVQSTEMIEAGLESLT